MQINKKMIGIFKFENTTNGNMCEMKAGGLFRGITVLFPVLMKKLNKKVYGGARGINITFTGENGDKWRVIVKQERRAGFERLQESE